MGSDSPTTGIVVLIAVAKMLANVDQKIPFKSGISNIMFAFLNGESFDYIGSSNMVYNMMNSTFPPLIDTKTTDINDDESSNTTNENNDKLTWPKIKLQSLKFVLELDQLHAKNSLLHTHVDKEFNRNDLLNNFINVARNHEVSIKNATDKERGLPPASLQTILKERRDVPGILLSNFDQNYSNKYYHGPYDNFTLLDIYDWNKGVEQDIVKTLSKGNYMFS